MPTILIIPENNYHERLLPKQTAPAPLVLTGSWQDLPANHLILTTSVSSIGIWLDIDSGVSVQVRLMATYDINSNDFYALPIQSPTSTQVGINEHKYEFTTSGTQKIVFSVPLASVLRYVKVQVKGAGGQINNAFLTARGG